METVPAEQFLKLQERMRCLEEENTRTKAENTMLTGQFHDIYEKSDDADNKDVKGKEKQWDKEGDKESEVRGTRCHGFRDQMWAEFQEFKKATTNEAEKFKALVRTILEWQYHSTCMPKTSIYSPRLLTILQGWSYCRAINYINSHLNSMETPTQTSM